MAAPVARFSFRIPPVPIMTSASDARVAEIEIARRNAVIICICFFCVLCLLHRLLIYFFRFGKLFYSLLLLVSITL